MPRYHGDLTPHTMPDGSEVLLCGPDCTWVGDQCIPIPPHKRIIIQVRPPPPVKPLTVGSPFWIPLSRLDGVPPKYPSTDGKVRAYAGRLTMALHGLDTLPPPIVLTIVHDDSIVVTDGNHRLASYRLVRSMRHEPLRIQVRISSPVDYDVTKLIKDS